MKSSLIALFIVLAAAGCSVSDDSGYVPPQVGTDACTIDAQKQFVLDVMRDVYYWNDVLPANVDLNAYATPEDLLTYLISFQPLDDFSYIDLAAADAQFFGEGQYEGFGFSSRLEDDGRPAISQGIRVQPGGGGGLRTWRSHPDAEWPDDR